MELAIDIGNTNTKIGFFNKNKLVDTQIIPNKNISAIYKELEKSDQTKNCILSSVSDITNRIIKKLRKFNIPYLIFDHNTKIPVKNLYQTKATLGNDRLAAAIGANYLYPNNNLLIIDMGSAITIDMVNDKNEFIGGNISPGLAMRFNALHNYSSQLPLYSKSEDYNLTGQNTQEAITSGVQNGIIFEINRYIYEYSNIYKNLKPILTGGDAVFFGKKLKSPIFVDLNLVITGLYRILKYNEEII